MAILYIMMNLLVLWFGIANHNNLDGKLILAGTVSNLAVVSANNWEMPTYGGGIVGSYAWHEVNPKNANLPFLGDWINVPINTSGNVIIFSPGDILVIIGIGRWVWQRFYP